MENDDDDDEQSQRPLLEENTNTIQSSKSIKLIDETCQTSFQLSQDLLIEILSKLPLKSLLPLKTVSKSWKLLINSPILINKIKPRVHSFPLIWSNAKKNPFAEDSEFYPQLLLDKPNFYPVLIGSSNGLICMRTTHPFRRYLIFNPTTKDLSFIRLAPIIDGPDIDFADLYTTVFYFVSKTQEYRLATFNKTSYHDDVQIWILTLGKTHSWREIHGVLPGDILNSNYAISGSTIYWLGRDPDNGVAILICFDFVEERFRQISLPNSTTVYHVCRFLTVIEDSVNMIVYPFVKNEFFEIWILDDSETWVKQRTVGPLETGETMRPIDVWYDHKKVMVICSKTGEFSNLLLDLFYYNLETNEVGDFPTSFRPETLHIVSFVESLVSIEGLVPYIDSHVPCNPFHQSRRRRRGGRGRGRGVASSLDFW